MRKRLIAVPILLAIFSLFLFAPTPHALAADGSAGSISVSSNSILDGQIVTIWCYDLTASGDYHVNWTGENTGLTFTATAGDDDYVVDIGVDKPSASSSVTIYLRAGSAGTEIAKVTVTVQDLSTYLNTGLIIGAGVVIMMAVIIYAIVKRLGR